jgi:hypothetical protein
MLSSLPCRSRSQLGALLLGAAFFHAPAHSAEAPDPAPAIRGVGGSPGPLPWTAPGVGEWRFHLAASPSPRSRVALEASAGVLGSVGGALLGVSAGLLACAPPQGDCLNAVGVGGGIGGYAGAVGGVYGVGRWAGAEGRLGWSCLGGLAGLATGVAAGVWADQYESTQGVLVPVLVETFLVGGTVTGFELSALHARARARRWGGRSTR